MHVIPPVRGELCACSHGGGHAHLLPPGVPRFYTRKAGLCHLSRGYLNIWLNLPAYPLFLIFIFQPTYQIKQLMHIPIFSKETWKTNIAPKGFDFVKKVLQNQGYRYFEETGGNSVVRARQ